MIFNAILGAVYCYFMFDMEILENYVEEESNWLDNSKKESSLLDSIKNDILYLRNYESTGIYDIKKDEKSIQLH